MCSENEAMHWNVFWNKAMHSNCSDDPNEVLEQGLPPLVSDYSCSHIAQDVGTAGLDGTEVARQIKENMSECTHGRNM